MTSKISKIGIIGGTGVNDLLLAKGFKVKRIMTDYGAVLGVEGEAFGKQVIFINRHGSDYTAPAKINYRANIAALKSLGVDAILATSAVGAIKRNIKIGEFVLLSDFIDFTRSRIQTFTDKSFVDVSHPYSDFLAKKISAAAAKMRIKMHLGITYVCTEGPRFESKAEIKMFAKLGADVVGMTQVPEVVLAAEAKIPYAAIGIITNLAAGVSNKVVSAQEVEQVMAGRKDALSNLLSNFIISL